METLHGEQLAAPSVSSFEALPALADLFSTTQTLQNASRAGKATKSGMTAGPYMYVYLPLPLCGILCGYYSALVKTKLMEPWVIQLASNFGPTLGSNAEFAVDPDS